MQLADPVRDLEGIPPLRSRPGVGPKRVSSRDAQAPLRDGALGWFEENGFCPRAAAGLSATGDPREDVEGARTTTEWQADLSLAGVPPGSALPGDSRYAGGHPPLNVMIDMDGRSSNRKTNSAAEILIGSPC